MWEGWLSTVRKDLVRKSKVLKETRKHGGQLSGAGTPVGRHGKDKGQEPGAAWRGPCILPAGRQAHPRPGSRGPGASAYSPQGPTPSSARPSQVAHSCAPPVTLSPPLGYACSCHLPPWRLSQAATCHLASSPAVHVPGQVSAGVWGHWGAGVGLPLLCNEAFGGPSYLAEKC